MTTANLDQKQTDDDDDDKDNDIVGMDLVERGDV